jgi:Casein kinase 1 gamma C terminal
MTTPVPEAPSAAPGPRTMPAPEAVASGAQVPTEMLVPQPVATPRQLDHAEIKIEPPVERAAQKRVASRAAVPMREKKSVEASALRRAREAAARREGSHQMHSPSQPTLQRDDQPTAGISNDAPSILGFLLPGRRNRTIT